MNFYSPLRYPGGKRKLVNYIKCIFERNDLLDGEYAEPFAGGAGIALALLYEMYVSKIHINDLDPDIYNFWYCALNKPEELTKSIVDLSVDMDNWYKYKNILVDESSTPVEKATALFFLNRTNRSGIVTGGVIGGKEQLGKWKIDARFNKSELILRIQKIARYKASITLTNKDALEFLSNDVANLPEKALIYLDPPYYVKGGELYTHNYKDEDHKALSRKVHQLKRYWIVSYDNVQEISSLYENYRSSVYGISYTAQRKYIGKELMVFSSNLKIPKVEDPTKVKSVNKTKLL